MAKDEHRPPETAAETDAARADQPKRDAEAEIAHIREISQNARTTWFGLLALLAFVGVTLMAHKDAHFFAREVETQLPLVNIAVPTVAFFIGAPLLLTAVYAYLHLYLVVLWDALARARAEVEGVPLVDRIYPWLLSQSAVRLRWRARSAKLGRDEGSARHTAMDKVTGAIAVLITWVAGILALGRLWTESWALHNPWLSLWIAGCLLLAGWIGLRSLLLACRLMIDLPEEGRETPHMTPKWLPITTILAVMTLAWRSWEATHGGGYSIPRFTQDWPPGPWTLISTPAPPGPFTYSAKLREAQLIERPEGWQPYATWFETFEKTWREQNSLSPGDAIPPSQQYPFWQAAREGWARRLADVDGPSLQRADLRAADLTDAFLPAADLRGAIVDGADLAGARLPGARLRRADPSNARGDEIPSSLKKTILAGAQMQGADLRRAQMQGAILSRAEMQGAILSRAEMQGADLSRAQMQGVNLVVAQMKEAVLSGAQMQGADLRGAEMQGADLRGAQMQGADLRGAQMQGADL
ncbi:MAG: pentapeptide repeat-containing protein, partial [Pseudomonadota bacterium]